MGTHKYKTIQMWDDFIHEHSNKFNDPEYRELYFCRHGIWWRPSDGGCAPTDPMCIQAQRAGWSQQPIFSCRMRDMLYHRMVYAFIRKKEKTLMDFFKENS